jgi:hypothetical protein
MEKVSITRTTILLLVQQQTIYLLVLDNVHKEYKMIKTLNDNWEASNLRSERMEEMEALERKWQVEVSRLVEQITVPGSSMLREVRYQYIDMASGGDGGDLGFEENGQTTCRGINYPGYPDWVFDHVACAMGWMSDDD